MPLSDARPQSIESLYVSHHSWLQGWLRRRLGCREQAADVAHDTFLRLIGSLPGDIRLDEPRAYLTTTARRLLIDRARREQIEATYLAELAVAVQAGAQAPSSEDVYAAVQVLAQLCDVLDGLPARGQEAFLLHYLDGHTQAEVAQALGLSVRMVQKHLAQGLLRCQRIMDT